MFGNHYPKGDTSAILFCLLAALLMPSRVVADDKATAVEKDVWMKPPALGIMPSMIATVVNDVPKWDEGLGSNFNAEQWATSFKDLGASYVYGIAKWHDGFCYWDTDTTSYKSKNDYVGQLIKACQKHGLRYTFYFNHHTEGNPEWEHIQLHHPDGRPYRHGFPFPKHSVHTEFRQFTLDQIRELMTKYGRVDGIWLDHFRELADAKDLAWDGSKVKFTIKPSPSSTIVFEVPGGKPETHARRRTAPSREWTMAIADPMKVLKSKKKTPLSARERSALRLQTQKEQEDVNLELDGK